MKILIIGIGSDIAYFIAKQFALNLDNELICTSRNIETANDISKDLIIRTNNTKIFPVEFQPVELESHLEFFDEMCDNFGLPDIVVIAYGTLPNQDVIKNNFSAINNEISINFISIVSITTYFSDKFEKLNKGKIAVLSSVAGDRARGSNYICLLYTSRCV